MASTTREQATNLPTACSDGAHPAKSVLKEAVDAVLNSFAKHTHGYGRGKLIASMIINKCTLYLIVIIFPSETSLMVRMRVIVMIIV